jgi:DNA-binding NarL/FixJ family response regulator
MTTATQQRVDELLRDARTWDAARFADAARLGNDDPSLRRLAAGVFAIAGRHEALAAVQDVRLLAPPGAANLEEYIASLPGGPSAFDYAAVAAAAAWRGDADATYRLLRSGAAFAIESGATHIAIAIDERLAQHALLFGNVDVAQRAVAAALVLAPVQRAWSWHWRTAATAARLSVAVGDIARAVDLVAQSRNARSPEIDALFAPSAVALSALQDAAPSQSVATDELRRIALTCEAPHLAASAAMAWAVAEPSEPSVPSPAAVALRRALLRGSDGLDTIELYSITARYGDVDDARIATAALLAMAAYNRPFADAHAQLARAYILFRTGRHDAAAAAAGDAARAFAAIGLRGWTNESMLLLVRQEGDAGAPRRRPSALALTGRERQVAQLIRRGSSNRDVARVLDISEHTVERHVSSILSRLGLRSRWQLVDERQDEQ